MAQVKAYITFLLALVGVAAMADSSSCCSPDSALRVSCLEHATGYAFAGRCVNPCGPAIQCNGRRTNPSPNCRYLAGFTDDDKRSANYTDDNRFTIWSFASGKPVCEETSYSAGIDNVYFSPDERFLATASSWARVRLWDLQSGRPLADSTETTGDP